MESFFGNPWETGLGLPGASMMGGTQPIPTVPQMDLPTMFANGLAAQGIRPSQFFANPEIAREIVKPQGPDNPWDPTPDPGPPSMPWTRDVAGGGMDASAGGGNADMKTAKEGTLADKLAGALRGVKMPAAPPRPETPKIYDSPRAPAPPGSRGLGQGGELLQLLLAAMAGGQKQAPGLQVTPTLGATMRGFA